MRGIVRCWTSIATQYDPRVLVRILKGQPASAADYLDLLAERDAMIDEAARTLWQRFDAIVAPDGAGRAAARRRPRSTTTTPSAAPTR